MSRLHRQSMSVIVALTIAVAFSASRDLVRAQTADSVPPERIAAREAYRDARVGMFIHWGVYSLLGQGEWVMQERGIQVPAYEWLASTFNPVRFDAAAWVRVA